MSIGEGAMNSQGTSRGVEGGGDCALGRCSMLGNAINLSAVDAVDPWSFEPLTTCDFFLLSSDACSEGAGALVSIFEVDMGKASATEAAEGVSEIRDGLGGGGPTDTHDTGEVESVGGAAGRGF